MKHVFQTLAKSRTVVWISFAAISIWLCWQGYISESIPYGDVTFIYEFWASQALNTGYVVGIDEAWVYPIVALVPLLFVGLLSPEQYAAGWIVLVTTLNAAVIAVLVSKKISSRLGIRGHRGLLGAWFYLIFLIALGPISVSRLESIASPLVVLGMLCALSFPVISGALLAIATWIKVWPAAVIMVALISIKQRVRIVVGAVVFSLIVIFAVVFSGGGVYLFSFLTEQTSRGIQIEAPIASPILWLAIGGVPGYEIYYDFDILTYQVKGESLGLLSQISNVLLVLGVSSVLVWGLFLRRKVSAEIVFPSLALIITLCLIVFNKVGSPQYALWLLAPVLAGLVFAGNRFRTHAVFAIALAILTQIIYPYNYIPVLALDPLFIGLLSLRNAVYVVFLGATVWLLYKESKRDIWLPTNSDSIKKAS